MRKEQEETMQLPQVSVPEYLLLVRILHTIELSIETVFNSTYRYADCCIVFTNEAQAEQYKKLSRAIRDREDATVTAEYQGGAL